MGRQCAGLFVFDNHAAIDGVGASCCDGDVVMPLQRIDLRCAGEFLERAGYFNLQVHFRLGPGGRVLDLFSNDDCALADDFVKGFVLRGINWPVRHYSISGVMGPTSGLAVIL